MSAETLLTASHRLNRFFRIDARVGFLTDETLSASRILEREIGLAEAGAEHDPGIMRAAKECSRLLGIDDREHGGTIRIPTQIAFDALDRAISAAGGRKAEG